MEFECIQGKVKLPIIGIGTWGMDESFKKTSYNKCIRAIRTSIKLGMTHIDTAETYGNGHSEKIVGESIKGIDRKKLFITTKVNKKHLHYDDVIASAKGSLKRMGIKYIDLYLIHGPNHKIPLEETMKAMDYLIEKKIIRFIGVSNFSVELLKKAQSCTKNKIVANQVEYNLLKRLPEKKLLKYCQKNKIILIAYRPLAEGKLAKEGFRFLDELCLKYKKTQAQIAINWIISKKNVVVIPKSNSVTHVKENFRVIGWKLNQRDTTGLDKYFLKYWFFSNLLNMPARFFQNFIIRTLPEKETEMIKTFYGKVLKNFKNS